MDIEKNLNKKNPWEVTITSDRHELERNQRERLRDQAKEMCPDGLNYLGTMCTHVYARNDMLNTANRLAMGHLFIGTNEGDGLADTCNENLAMAALQDLVTQVKINYGHKPPRSRNPMDLRGKE